MYDRRSFLKAGTVSVLGGYLFLGPASVFGQTKGGGYFAIPASALSDSAANFTREAFLPYLNSNFSVLNKRRRVGSLRLVEVAERGAPADAFEEVNIDGFNLIFSAERDLALNDGIHRFSHPSLGEFSMFVSAVDRGGSQYQAIFSRLRN